MGRKLDWSLNKIMLLLSIIFGRFALYTISQILRSENECGDCFLGLSIITYLRVTQQFPRINPKRG